MASITNEEMDERDKIKRYLVDYLEMKDKNRAENISNELIKLKWTQELLECLISEKSIDDEIRLLIKEKLIESGYGLTILQYYNKKMRSELPDISEKILEIKKYILEITTRYSQKISEITSKEIAEITSKCDNYLVQIFHYRYIFSRLDKDRLRILERDMTELRIHVNKMLPQKLKDDECNDSSMFR